jgi:hypothetical protein
LNIYEEFNRIRSKIREEVENSRTVEASAPIEKIAPNIISWLSQHYFDTTQIRHRGFHGWTWNLRRHKNEGFIPYRPESFLHGCLISILEDEPFIVRDYPPLYEKNIALLDDIKISNKRIHPIINGVEIRTWVDKTGTFWGKTRHIEYLKRNSSNNMDFDLILEITGYKEKLDALSRDNRKHVVFGSIFGEYIKGGYADYGKGHGYIAYDILNLDTDRFLTPKEAFELCELYNIPFIGDAKTKEIATELYSVHGGIYIKTYIDGDMQEVIRIRKPLEDDGDKIREALLYAWEST